MKSALSGLLLLFVSMAAQADAPWLFVPTVHYVTHEPLYSVFVINPRSNAIDREIPVDGRIHHTRVNADGTRLYATVPEAQQLLVFDTIRGALHQTVDLGFEPLDLALDESGGEIYVGEDGPSTIHVLDLESLAEVRSLELEAGELREIMHYTEEGHILARQRGPSGEDWPIRMYDDQSGDLIDSYGEDINQHLPLLDPADWFLLTIDSENKLRAAIAFELGFVELSVTELPFTATEMVADWQNWRLYIQSQSTIHVLDLVPLLLENPTGAGDGDVFLGSVDSTTSGTISVDSPGQRIYVAQELMLPPVGTPPFGEPPTEVTMLVHELSTAPFQVQETFDTNIIGGATSRGPFIAGEALPNAPAIPTLGPAGIGVLIVLMMGMAIRRYRLRARFHSSTPPS